MQPDLFADFLAVAEGVSEFADFYFSGVVLIEDLEDFEDVGGADEEEAVGAVGEELGEEDPFFVQSFHYFEGVAFAFLLAVWA